MLINEDALISVIVPIYNVEKYILKCLQSIKNQTYKNIEVILINDGSTDHSGEIAENFARTDKRFCFFVKENGGLSSARNAGLNHSNGEYIYFLDSDDWIQNDYLEKMIIGFEDDIDIVIGKYILEDTILDKVYIPYKHECLEKKFFSGEKEKEILERHINAYPGSGYLIKNTLMPVWKNMYRRKFLIDNHITFVSERLVGAEDYVFNFEAYYYAKGIKVLNTTGCVHVIVQGSLSRKYNEDAYERVLKRMEMVSKSIEDKSFYNKKKILEALENEELRLLIGHIYGIVKADTDDKINKIKTLLKNEKSRIILKRSKNPNIERKYLLLYYLIKYCGVYITYISVSAAMKGYILYRKFEYIKRR